MVDPRGDDDPPGAAVEAVWGRHDPIRADDAVAGRPKLSLVVTDNLVGRPDSPPKLTFGLKPILLPFTATTEYPPGLDLEV